MYISNVEIVNYRNFINTSIDLFPFSIIIGENDTGKTNFLKAINLVLYNKSQNYYSKSLYHNDFNLNSVNEFYEKLIEEGDFSEEYCFNNIPVIEITITFDNIDALGEESRAIVNSWLVYDQEKNKTLAKIKYKSFPLANKKKEIYKYCKKAIERKMFFIPSEYYDYKIISLSDEKKVDYDELQRVISMVINAERDESSISLVNSRKNSILPKMLKESLSDDDKVELSLLYDNMLKSVVGISSIKSLKTSFNSSFKEILNNNAQLSFLPNAENSNELLYSLKLGYENCKIEDKGLGTKNVVLISLLLSKYIEEIGVFNLIAIEEPESHLSVTLMNKLVGYLEKVQKEVKQSKRKQIIITTHSSYVINKLNIKNVIVFSENNVYNLYGVSKETTEFFMKMPNYELLNVLFLNKVLLVEGPSEEIFINSILSRNNVSGKLLVVSINGVAFKRYIEVWKNKKNNNNINDCIGILTDSDCDEKKVSEYSKYNDEDNKIYVGITRLNKRTFENELIDFNQQYLENLYNKKGDSLEKYMTNNKNKTQCALKLSDRIINTDDEFKVPCYIDVVLRKLIGDYDA